MNFRLRLTAWYALSVLAIVAALIWTAHRHLDEELRSDRWDRTHPKFPQWIIHGSYTDAEVQDVLGELIKVWLWVGIPAMLASVGAGYFIALRSVRPIRKINRELAALDARSLADGVTLPEKDPELALLVHQINDLLLRVHNSYSELAEFSARVAHELRTPLTILRMRLESAAPELPAEFSEDMQEELHRLSQLVERSLLTAKAEGGKLDVQIGTVDVSRLLEDFRESYDILTRERSIALEWRIPPALEAASDPELLRQILHNLIGNALRHGGATVRIHALRPPATGRIAIRIVNAIDRDISAPGGTGMGLRLVRSIARALDETHFQIRQTSRVFAIQLALPSASPASPSSSGGMPDTVKQAPSWPVPPGRS